MYDGKRVPVRKREHKDARSIVWEVAHKLRRPDIPPHRVRCGQSENKTFTPGDIIFHVGRMRVS